MSHLREILSAYFDASALFPNLIALDFQPSGITLRDSLGVAKGWDGTGRWP